MVEIIGKPAGRDDVDQHEFITLQNNEDMLKDSHTAVRDPKNPRVAIIRTSDRITFKNCRRRWGWSSHLRHNLGPNTGISPLWFGTGMHFALEDFHGYNRFGHPTKAFMAYVDARKRHDPELLPDDVTELIELGQGMMDYYVIWLQQRTNTLLRTFWFNGIPQVEVNFKFRVPWDPGKFGYDEVYYSGTIDRICEDQNGLLWPLDYKSAKVIETLHYLTDPQVSVYDWAAPHIYDRPIGGFLYQQHRKATPNKGRILKNGSVSLDKSQLTTRLLYKQTLIEVYGDVEKAPPANQDFLTYLAQWEDETQDSFVRIDKITRNERRQQSEGVKILLEIEDMLNPDLALYPNPTRDCPKFCPFYSPCVSLDDGGDWKHELRMTTMPRDPVYDTWRKRIVWPGDGDPKKLDMGDRSWLEASEV